MSTIIDRIRDFLDDRPIQSDSTGLFIERQDLREIIAHSEREPSGLLTTTLAPLLEAPSIKSFSINTNARGEFSIIAEANHGPRFVFENIPRHCFKGDHATQEQHRPEVRGI